MKQRRRQGKPKCWRSKSVRALKFFFIFLNAKKGKEKLGRQIYVWIYCGSVDESKEGNVWQTYNTRKARKEGAAKSRDSFFSRLTDSLEQQ